MEHWGYHALFDCSSCNKNYVKSEDNIYNFIVELVQSIDMVAYGEPIIEHFATHCEDKAGYSFVQMIETSSITGHLVDKTGDAYIDIFSCKPFDLKIAEDVIKCYFDPQKIRMNFITRNA